MTEPFRFFERSVGNDKWIVVVGKEFLTHEQAIKLREGMDYILDNNYLHQSIREMTELIDQTTKVTEGTPT